MRIAVAACVAAVIASGCDPGGAPPSVVTGPMVATPMISYLATQTELPLQGPILVLDQWDGTAYAMFRGQDGEVSAGSAAVSEATPLDFGSLDDVTRDAIGSALGDSGPPEFVAAAEEAQDEGGTEHLGCLPVRGDGTLITLGVPLQPFVPANEENARLIASAAVSRGCSGETWLLELTWDGDAYSAGRIDGFSWIV